MQISLSRIPAFLFLLGWAFLLGSCYDKPDFVDQPVITFNRVEVDLASSNNVQTSINLVVNFQDGDGDLGISQAELDSDDSFFRRFSEFVIIDTMVSVDITEDQDTIYDTTFVDVGVFNPYSQNIFVTTYKQLGEEFVEVEFPLPSLPLERVLNYNGTFPILFENENDDGPLEGEIEYSFLIDLVGNSLNPRAFQPGDLLRFEVQVSDRALNLSNIVLSDTIRVEQVIPDP